MVSHSGGSGSLELGFWISDFKVLRLHPWHLSLAIGSMSYCKHSNSLFGVVWSDGGVGGTILRRGTLNVTSSKHFMCILRDDNIIPQGIISNRPKSASASGCSQVCSHSPGSSQPGASQALGAATVPPQFRGGGSVSFSDKSQLEGQVPCSGGAAWN